MNLLHRPATTQHNDDVLLSLLVHGDLRGARTVLSARSPPPVDPDVFSDGLSLLGWALRCHSWRALDGNAAGRTSEGILPLPLSPSEPWPDISSWEAAPWVGAVLLANGVDPWIAHQSSRPDSLSGQIDAFDGAIQWGRPGLVSAMLRHPSAPPVEEVMRRVAPIAQLPGNIKPPPLFHTLCATGDATMVSALLQAGGNARMLDEAGRTALFWATTPAVVKCLLEAGVDPSLQVKGQDASAFWFEMSKKEPKFWAQRMDERLKVLRDAGFSKTADRTESTAVAQVFEAVDSIKWFEAVDAAKRYMGLPKNVDLDEHPEVEDWLRSLRRESTKGAAAKLGNHSLLVAACCRYLRGASNRKTGMLRSVLEIHDWDGLSAVAAGGVQGWGFAWLAVHSIDTAGYSQSIQRQYQKVLLEKAQEKIADPALMFFEQSLLATVWTQPRLSSTAASNARSFWTKEWGEEWKRKSHVTQDEWVEVAARHSAHLFTLGWWPPGNLTAVHQFKLEQGDEVLRHWTLELLEQAADRTRVGPECFQKLESVRDSLSQESWSDPAFFRACERWLGVLVEQDDAVVEVAQWRSCFLETTLSRSPQPAARRSPRF